MPEIGQLRLLPIQDEDFFEDFCRDLWALIWKDTDATRNGRKGQSQCGVDVFGLPATETQHEGVQAKAYGRPLTEKEIKHEVEEAKKFKPPLRKLIIACTGPRDAPGQEYVRHLNLEHRSSGLFSVSLLGWEDIVRLVQEHFVATRPDLLHKYFEITTTSALLKPLITEALAEAVSEIKGKGIFSVAQVEALPSPQNQGHYHSQLDYARTLVNAAKPEQALEYVANCREKMWHDAQPAVRFRILHYQGCANYLLERTRDAGQCLVEALQYNPDDESALAFAALGYLLLGDNDNAAHCARQALTRNPSSGKAYATLIRTLDTSQPFETLLATVPEAYRGLPEVANALANLARQKGLIADAEQWCRVAIAGDQENWADLHGLLGEILMQQALDDWPMLPGMGINETQYSQLEQAEKAFTQAWEQISPEIKRTHISWLVNRGATRFLLGNSTQAAADFDAALQFDPENSFVIRRRANLATYEGENARAIELLQRIRPSAEQSGAVLMLAELLAETEQYDTAERTLEQLPKDQLSKEVALSVERIRFRIAITRKDWQKAQQLYKDIAAEYPDHIDVLLDGAWLSRLTENPQESRALLTKATNLLSSDSSPHQRHSLATAWYENQDYMEAARLYEQLVDRDVESPLTRRLLVCLYNCGKLNQALELAQHLLAQHGPLPMVSTIAVTILDEAGDLPNAKRTAEAYLTLYPDDFDMRFHLAAVLHRLGDMAGVDAFLDGPVNLGSLTMTTALRVASLYAAHGRLGPALDIAYEVRRKHIGESDAHLFYIDLFFQANNQLHEEHSSPSAVGLDTAVCISDSSGEKKWHIIEERSDYNLPVEIAPDHPLASRLMGLNVGTTKTIKQNEISTVTITVSEIQSKFVHAAQESMRTFEHMFPNTEGLWNIKLPTIGEGPESEELDFTPLFQIITRQHERGLAAERLYREGSIPLAVVSKLMGQNIIQTWSNAVQKHDFGILCSIGFPGELAAARNVVETRTSLVLEPIALLTLHGLETRDILTDRFGAFCVPQSLIDMIQHARQECVRIKSKGFMRVGKQRDQFVREEVTPEIIQGNIAYLDDLLDWIRKNCVIAPITSALGESRGFHKKFETMMDPCFIDCILISSGDGKVLYCDDERLRTLAKTESDVSGVWTQVLLGIVLEENLIDRDTYSRDIIRLLASNYSHVQINSGLFLVAARQAEWRPVAPFTTVTNALSGAKSELTSATYVAAEAIYNIWKEPLMVHQRDLLVTQILNSLCSRRSSVMVIKALMPMLRARFHLLPLHHLEVQQLIATWASTRPM